MTLADPAQLVDVDALIGAYYDHRPDPEVPEQRVAFGTSGHRGTSRASTFTESHVLAVAEAVCRHRAPHGVDVVVDDRDGYTPTPVISHAIITHNRAGEGGTADGIVVTPSHNPPEDGGIKYNPPHGGPADTTVTGWIEREANALLEEGLRGVLRPPPGQAPRPRRRDY